MEIVLRAGVVYLFLWFLLRALGKRELTEVTAFELVLLVVLGDIVQQGITQEDMSITGSAVAASTIAMLAVGSSVIAQRFPRTRPVLEGRPSVIVHDGRLVDENLRSLRITVDEVHEAVRKQGYRSLDHLEWVIVEADGKFSFIETPTGADSRDATAGGSGIDDDDGHTTT